MHMHAMSAASTSPMVEKKPVHPVTPTSDASSISSSSTPCSTETTASSTIPPQQQRKAHRRSSGLLVGIAEALESIMEEKEEGEHATVYDALQVPPVTILEYIERWWKFLSLPQTIIPLALIYILRLYENGFKLTPYNVHRVVLGAIVLASKWHLDQPETNTYYSEVGGVCIEELNRIEVQLLHDLQWDISVESTTLMDVLADLHCRRL
eukprot:Sspe_Gene.71998::Locus_42814_Transcript_1_1_Confidence_1.000_Length_1085::g.71998::m.71998